MAQAPRVIRLPLANGGKIELRNDVPAKRSECVDGPRPCPHVKCRYHLWIIEGHDRPGRPSPHGRPKLSTLRPAWLEDPIPPSCALDVAERCGEQNGDWNVAEMSAAIALRPSQFRDVLARALAKLRRAGVVLREIVQP